MSFGELVLTALFFPVFGLLGAAFLWAAGPVISEMIAPKYQDRFYGAVLIGAALPASLLVIMYLNCWLLIDLPFTERGCRLIGF